MRFSRRSPSLSKSSTIRRSSIMGRPPGRAVAICAIGACCHMRHVRTAPSRAIQAEFLCIAFRSPLKFRALYSFYAIQGSDERVRLVVMAESGSVRHLRGQSLPRSGHLRDVLTPNEGVQRRVYQGVHVVAQSNTHTKSERKRHVRQRARAAWQTPRSRSRRCRQSRPRNCVRRPPCLQRPRR